MNRLSVGMAATAAGLATFLGTAPAYANISPPPPGTPDFECFIPEYSADSTRQIFANGNYLATLGGGQPTTIQGSSDVSNFNVYLTVPESQSLGNGVTRRYNGLIRVEGTTTVSSIVGRHALPFSITRTCQQSHGSVGDNPLTATLPGTFPPNFLDDTKQDEVEALFAAVSMEEGRIM